MSYVSEDSHVFSDRHDGHLAPNMFIIMITSIAVGSTAVVAVIIALYCRITGRKRHNGYNTTPQSDADIEVEGLPWNVCYHQKPDSGAFCRDLQLVEYPRNDVEYLKDIGVGAFGRVFQAKAPHLVKGQETTVIAVKMLREDATEQMQVDFEREAELMLKFRHPNIVRLLGVCAIGEPLCLLFEYMTRGDLNEFLRSCSPEHFIVRNRSTEILCQDSPKLDHGEQLAICQQIASAMVYVTEQGYVHRDLATRNCLVGENLTVKLSDFGLTRLVGEEEYYQGNDGDAIPIRWLPLESILYNQFTHKSDIWSFGVVIWEVFSFAVQPYSRLSLEEVVHHIKDGKVLSCPDNTPQEVYDLMRLCWSRNPQNRPPFTTIYESLTKLHDEYHKKKRKSDRDKL